MTTLDITMAQINSGRSNNQLYFWRLELDNGSIIDQYDPKTGVEQQFPNWVKWVERSADDPNKGNPCFGGIKAAYWIPVDTALSAHYLQRGDASYMIIYRKNYSRVYGLGYTAYCIGQRWDGENPSEIVYHICPPARYDVQNDMLVDLRSNVGVYFPGGVSQISSPIQPNAFDEFLVLDKHR